jgi:hypothetical protein
LIDLSLDERLFFWGKGMKRNDKIEIRRIIMIKEK